MNIPDWWVLAIAGLIVLGAAQWAKSHKDGTAKGLAVVGGILLSAGIFILAAGAFG